jgi:hypothetical protein
MSLDAERRDNSQSVLIQALPLNLVHRPLVVVLQVRPDTCPPKLSSHRQSRRKVNTRHTHDIDVAALRLVSDKKSSSRFRLVIERSQPHRWGPETERPLGFVVLLHQSRRQRRFVFLDHPRKLTWQRISPENLTTGYRDRS